MYTTDQNKTGRVLNGRKLKNLQNFIIRKARVFGLSVIDTFTPTVLNPVNQDAIQKQVESLVLARKKKQIHGQSALFINLANMVGVTFNGFTALNVSPSTLAISDITATTATADWLEFEVPGYTDITYDIVVTRNSNNVEVVSDNVSLLTYDITGLVAEVEYTVKVRARWNSNAFASDWTTETFTTTA